MFKLLLKIKFSSLVTWKETEENAMQQCTSLYEAEFFQIFCGG